MGLAVVVAIDQLADVVDLPRRKFSSHPNFTSRRGLHAGASACADKAAFK